MLDERGESGEHLVVCPARRDIVGTKMHSNDIGWVRFQPANELILVGNVDGLETCMALVVLVVGEALASRSGCLTSNEVNIGVVVLHELIVELCAPTAELRNGVAEGHVPDFCLRQGEWGESGAQ